MRPTDFYRIPVGFRSVFITEDTGLDLPAWFLDKWREWWHFHEYEVDGQKKLGLPCSSKFEHKIYNLDGWHEDLQRVLRENTESIYKDHKLVLVWLHECNGVSRVEITRDKIVWTEPTGWEIQEDGPSHSYCYGCSDADNYDPKSPPAVSAQ